MVESTNFGAGNSLGKEIFHMHTKLHCNWEIWVMPTQDSQPSQVNPVDLSSSMDLESRKERERQRPVVAIVSVKGDDHPVLV